MPRCGDEFCMWGAPKLNRLGLFCPSVPRNLHRVSCSSNPCAMIDIVLQLLESHQAGIHSHAVDLYGRLGLASGRDHRFLQFWQIHTKNTRTQEWNVSRESLISGCSKQKQVIEVKQPSSLVGEWFKLDQRFYLLSLIGHRKRLDCQNLVGQNNWIVFCFVVKQYMFNEVWGEFHPKGFYTQQKGIRKLSPPRSGPRCRWFPFYPNN